MRRLLPTYCSPEDRISVASVKSETFGIDERVSVAREHSEIKRGRSVSKVSCANDDFPDNREPVDLYLRYGILFQRSEHIDRMQNVMNKTLQEESQRCNNGSIAATGKPSIKQILEGTLRAKSNDVSKRSDRDQTIAIAGICKAQTCSRATRAIDRFVSIERLAVSINNSSSVAS